MASIQHHGDCDCHYWSVTVADELIAHRIAENHARDAHHDYDDIEWSVIEG